MTDEEVCQIVADAIEASGHGNKLFIDSVRRGDQNEGPFMMGALAVRNAMANRDSDD